MAAIPGHYEYTIRAGDTLTGILQRIYDVGESDPRHARSLEHLLALNPHIRNPNSIRAGDVLRLTESLPEDARQGYNPPRSVIAAPLISEGVSDANRAGFQAVTWLADNSNYFLIPGSVVAGGGANLLSGGNIQHIHRMQEAYAQFKSGAIGRGAYEYRRTKALRALQANIGPLDRVLFGQGGSQQKLRIARAGGVPANANLAKHAGRLQTLGQTANIGGLALTGVGLAASCVQIANTVDRREKNQIFVEGVSSSIVGFGGGAVVGLFLATNPVGWGTALILAAGTAAWGYAAGKAARAGYDAWNRPYDFVSGSGVDHICRR